MVIGGEAFGDGVPDRARVGEAVHEDDGRSRSTFRHGKSESRSANMTFGSHAPSQPRWFEPAAVGRRRCYVLGAIAAFRSSSAALSSAERFLRAESAEASCSPVGVAPPERIR